MTDRTTRRHGVPHRQNSHSALRRALTSEIFLARRIERMMPVTLIALLTCTATVLSPEGGPLFMVAGDPNGAVGVTIGFIGNIIDHTHVAESAVRASLVYTVAWIPAAAILGVTAIGEGVASNSAQISQAKGMPGGAVILARVTPQAMTIAAAYLISCGIAFAAKSAAYGIASNVTWQVALTVLTTNCLLLCAIYLASACVTAVCRIPLFAILLALLLHIGPLLAHPRAYVAGTSPEIAWASPVVWLMHTCSLNMAGPTFAFGAMVAAGICIASMALMYLACNRQEACR